jgi:NAD(P)-dependent dehydrogenase (short-subunit alcohol dehydrogenase family)
MINDSFINDPNELKGRRALITGGSRGIGVAVVRCLLSVGTRVVAVARNPVEDFLSAKEAKIGALVKKARED